MQPFEQLSRRKYRGQFCGGLQLGKWMGMQLHLNIFSTGSHFDIHQSSMLFLHFLNRAKRFIFSFSMYRKKRPPFEQYCQNHFQIATVLFDETI